MLDSLRSLFRDLAGGQKQPERFEDNDYRLAAAALLIHLIGSDGVVAKAERDRLHSVLKDRFALDDAATSALIEEAAVMEGEAVDFYRFTSLLKRRLDDEGRRRIIEMMWELVYADGKVNEFEDNLVWRVADLLHVPSRDRMMLRSQVAAAAGAAPPATDRE